MKNVINRAFMAKKKIILLSCMIMLSVTAGAVAISQVRIYPTSVNVIVGQPLKFTYQIIPEGAEASSVEFVSDDPSAVMVYNDGTASVYKKSVTTIHVNVKDKETSIIHTDQCPVNATYRAYGSCGTNLYYSIDYDYRLTIWASGVDDERDEGLDYSMENYSDAMPAPWITYASQITDVNLGWAPKKIGNYAFLDLINLSYIILPDKIDLNSEKVFYGCKNLKTIESRWESSVPEIKDNTLLIDTETGKEVPVLIVGYAGRELYEDYKNSDRWNKGGRVITLSEGTLPKNEHLGWSLNKSDSLQALKLRVDRAESQQNPDTVFVQDYESADQLPWYDVSEYVEELYVSNRVGYIGKNAFSAMTNLQMVQFNQSDVQIDSIHYDAFSHEAEPWKFAFGEPLYGPVRPPKVVGMPASAATNFQKQTVLYVPDSTLTIGNEKVKTVTLYRNAPFWSQFNRITDRTVDTLVTPESTVKLDWLPLENAKMYRLHISKEGCATCDTVIDIPAEGLKGLVNWEQINTEDIIPQYIAARRAPKDEGDGGGLVLTISIKTGSGKEHNEDVEVQVAGMTPNVKYHFFREVVMDYGINPELTKYGSFTVPEKAAAGLNEVTVSDEGLEVTGYGLKVYDILGRRMGSDMNALPDGIYILDNGTKRTTILLRR